DQPVLVGVPLLPLVLEALGLGDLALVEEAVAVGVVHLEQGLGVESLLLAGAFPLLGAAPGPLGGSARRLRVLAVPDRLLACLRSLLPVFEELLFGQLAVGDPLFLGERLQRVAPPHRLLDGVIPAALAGEVEDLVGVHLELAFALPAELP